MAAVGGHNDMLQVLAHRHHRSMTTNTAARTKRHRNTSNNKDGSRQRNVNPRLQNRDSALRGNIQPTPSPRFADPSLAMEEAQTSPSGLPVSSAAEADTLPIGNTVAPRAAIVGDPGALPGVNQPDPGTFSKPMPGVNQPDPGRMDAPLPGKNQPPPLMGDAAAPPPPQGMPGMNPPGPGVMNPPMPGTNQPPPLIGDAAAPPPPKGMPGMNPPGPGAMNPPGPGVMNPPMPGKDQPQPLQDMPASILCTSITTYTTQTQARTDPTLTISKSGMNTGFSWPTPSTTGVPSVGSSVPGLAPLPSFSTFILFSRSEDIREQVTTSTNSANTPLAVTASSALTAISVPALLPTSSSIASSATGGPSRGLTPLSRSLFVLFGVLGKQKVLAIHKKIILT
jgi:hypothetical protein